MSGANLPKDENGLPHMSVSFVHPRAKLAGFPDRLRGLVDPQSPRTIGTVQRSDAHRRCRMLIVVVATVLFMIFALPLVGMIGAVVISTAGILLLIDSGLTAAGALRVRRFAAASSFGAQALPTHTMLDALTGQSIIGTDLSGRIDVWNPGAEAMLGFSAAETEGRRNILDLHVANELEKRSDELDLPDRFLSPSRGFAALVESARRGQSEVREWTYRKNDGGELTVSIAVTPRFNNVGTLVGYAFLGTDLTASIEASRIRDQFVGLISHELRTPLSSILGYLDLMKDDEKTPLSSTQLKYLEVAQRNSNRLLGLVGDLLFTAQLSAGEFPVEIGLADLADVVRCSVASAGPSAAQAGVKLVVEGVRDQVSIPGDAMRLSQAFDNLISNAIKFSRPGGQVAIRLVTLETSAVITVCDTGIGIPAHELENLYGLYFRSSTARRARIPGVGLGLSITKSIVTSHDGLLEVESGEGAGTTFTMTLPLATVKAGVAA